MEGGSCREVFILLRESFSVSISYEGLLKIFKWKIL